MATSIDPKQHQQQQQQLNDGTDELDRGIRRISLNEQPPDMSPLRYENFRFCCRFY